MAYTIVKSDGSVLTTIQDGTIDTESTSLALPGRNYSGYGQSLDTNFVHLVENFADDNQPANPLVGQLWYNTNTNELAVNDGTEWLVLTTTSSSGVTTFGELSVTGNVYANNFIAVNDFIGNRIHVQYADVDVVANVANATINMLNIGDSITVHNITTSASTDNGNLTGVWHIYGGSGGASADAMVFETGGIKFANSQQGIKCDKYMWGNGVVVDFGNYSNANVANYLPTFTGTVGTVTVGYAAKFLGGELSTGSESNVGNIVGTWNLVGNSRMQATYADLAERFEADTMLEPGTVVEIGGEKEITAVKNELSDSVFGVVSDTAAYLMNAAAGNDKTHPAIAVSGRVQVKVKGQVKKGDRLVSAGSGTARSAKPGEATAFNTIGRALVEKDTDGLGTVEAIVIIR